METKDQEIWKPIIGYEGLYEVSNYGRVKSISKKIGRPDFKDPIHKRRGDIILKCNVSANRKKSYPRVNLGRKGKCKLVHSLVAEAFIPNPENKPTVNHKDGNKLNNHLSNLEWATYKENNNHAYLMGLNRPQLQNLIYGKRKNIITRRQRDSF